MKVTYGLGLTSQGLASVKFQKTCVAIGIFDGVHRGHQRLITQMVAEAKKLKAKAVVITFFPHPAHVLRPDISLPYLMSVNHRLKMLEQLGVDEVLIIKFNKQFARIDPRLFIENFLVGRLAVQSVFVGQDFRFGKDRSGDIALFKELARASHYRMHAIKPVKQAGEPISSSRVRRLIPQGKLKQAQALLGRPVAILGQVIKGSSRGKKLGYPTANIKYDCDVLPPTGVYAVHVKIGSKKFSGMANLGCRPSFKGDNRIHLEVHVFNFNRNIYGQNIVVEFIKKIRNEKKFLSKEALISQIQQDESTVRRLLKVE
jgi:riboflavin kinase/FMN adenylyltransferase